MSIKLILMIALALLMVVGTPVALVWMLMTHKRERGSERRGGGGVSSFVGAAMLDLDRVIRPSIEHTIETEERVVKREDDKGGE